VTKAVQQNGGIQAEEQLLLATVCDPADLAQFDLLVFSGAQVSSGLPEILTPVVDALRQRQFVAFGTFTVAKFLAEEENRAAAGKAALARQQAEREQAIANFQTRDSAVISAIRLEAPATVVCLVVADPEGTRYLLGRADQPFDGLIGPGTAFRNLRSVNDLFIALKKRDCTAAVAAAGQLRDVLGALVRDGGTVEVQAGTLPQDRLDNWKLLSEQELVVKQDQQTRDLAERRRQDAIQKAETDQKQALENERRKQDEAARQEETAKMRKQVSSKANAVVDGFTTSLSGHMTAIYDAIASRKAAKSDTVSAFQDWSDWYEAQVKEQWEFSPLRASVEDYGRAQWRGRTIEAIAVRVQFPIMNRLIGEKKTACFQFIWINDEEFDFRRNQKSVLCQAYEPAFDKWSQENAFVSQWKLLEGGE
jgi:hypothetical protein